MKDRDGDDEVRREAEALDKELLRYVVEQFAARNFDGRTDLTKHIRDEIDTAVKEAAVGHAKAIDEVFKRHKAQLVTEAPTAPAISSAPAISTFTPSAGVSAVTMAASVVADDPPSAEVEGEPLAGDNKGIAKSDPPPPSEPPSISAKMRKALLSSEAGAVATTAILAVAVYGFIYFYGVPGQPSLHDVAGICSTVEGQANDLEAFRREVRQIAEREDFADSYQAGEDKEAKNRTTAEQAVVALPIVEARLRAAQGQLRGLDACNPGGQTTP